MLCRGIDATLCGKLTADAFTESVRWTAEAVNDPLIIEVGKNVAFLKAKSEIFMDNVS